MKKEKIISDYTKQLEAENEELHERLAKLEELSDPYIPSWTDEYSYTPARHYLRSKTTDYGYIEKITDGYYSIAYILLYTAEQHHCTLDEAKKMLEAKALKKYG